MTVVYTHNFSKYQVMAVPSLSLCSIVPQEAFDLIIETFGEMYEEHTKKKD